MNDEAPDWRAAASELTEDEKRANAIRLAFGGEVDRFNEFVETLGAELPEQTAAVLGGSSVSGFRWEDGSPFDADGPFTSDLDLTLVGNEILSVYGLTGFYVPGVHTRPLNDDTLDIAPDLVPLRRRLMKIVKNRPVNIQATRDFYVWIREHWLGQPYLLLVGKVEEDEA